jgi:hypothetical protein
MAIRQNMTIQMKDWTTELPLTLVNNRARQTVSSRRKEGGADEVVWVEDDAVKDWRNRGEGGGAGAQPQLTSVSVHLPVFVEEDGCCQTAVALVASFRYWVSNLHS